MRTSEPGAASLPEGTPAVAALHAIERAFPGAPRELDVVVTGAPMDTPAAQGELVALGRRAARVTGGRGAVAVKLSGDARTARVSVPLPDRGVQHDRETVAQLRASVTPTAAGVAPGATALVTGGAAREADFGGRLDSATPVVIAFVLGLAFLLLLAAFGSPALALAMIGLNLLSIGAAYGVLTAVFQNVWAESLLGFSSSATVVSWVPLFLFVILFGLSMDYTVLVLERIREAAARA